MHLPAYQDVIALSLVSTKETVMTILFLVQPATVIVPSFTSEDGGLDIRAALRLHLGHFVMPA